MGTTPRAPVPAEAVLPSGVIETAKVQNYYWPEQYARQAAYVAALGTGRLNPSVRELIRMRSARTTGCTY